MFLPNHNPTPATIGDSADAVGKVAAVDQFESGVFMGVRPSRTPPQFRDGGVWTEDEEMADLGDAIVEVRAFDTTYVSVASTDHAIRRRLARGILGTV